MIKERFQHKPEILKVDPRVSAQVWDGAMDVASLLGPEAFTTEHGVRAVIGAASDLVQVFPAQIFDAGAAFQERGNANGAVVLSGLHPPAAMNDITSDLLLPTDPYSVAAGIVAVTATTAFGPPISFQTHPNGAVEKFATSVATLPGYENSMSVSRTSDTGWHTEVGASLWRPAAVVLYCVRGSADAVNRIIPPRRLMERLEPGVLDIMRESRFIIPDGLVPGSTEYPRPVLTDTRRGPAITYRYKTGSDIAMRPADSEDFDAWAAMHELDFLLDQEGESLATQKVLEPGDVLAMDNNGVHSRGKINRSRRWGIRVFGGEQAHLLNGPFVDPTRNFPSPAQTVYTRMR